MISQFGLGQKINEATHILESSSSSIDLIFTILFIRQAVTDFNWDRAFLSINVNKKGSIFGNTIMNILINFIPHETIVCENKDPLGLIKQLNPVPYPEYIWGYCLLALL